MATASQAATDFTGLGYSEFAYGITDEDYYLTERVTVYGFPKGEYFLRVVVTVTDGTYSPYPATGSPSLTNNRRLSIPNALTYTDSDHGTSAVSIGNGLTYFTSTNDNQTLLDGGSLSLMPPEQDATSNKYAGIFIGGRGETSDANYIQPLGGIWFYEGMDDMGTGAGSLGSPDYAIYMPSTGGNLLFSGNVNFNNNVDVDGTLSINGVTVNAGAVTGPAGSDGQIQYNNGGALGGSSNLTFNDSTNTLSVTNLTVSGTTTTIDTTNLNVSDKNITLNYGTGDTSANADGAGITIQDAVDSSTDATILWDATNDEFDFSHGATFAGDTSVYTGATTGSFNVGRSSAQRFNFYVTDGLGYIRYYQDETGTTNHSVNFEIQSSSSGTNQFYFNKGVNVTGGTTASSFTTNGSRVVSVSNGAITMKGESGGWAFGLHAIGNAGTNHGGFGFLGGDDNFTYYYIGAAYNDANVFKFYKSGNLSIAGNATVAGTLTGQKLVSTDGVLELDDNGTHNGIINVPASLRINIDSDNNNTGESFQVGNNATDISGSNILFKVAETGTTTVNGNLFIDSSDYGGFELTSDSSSGSYAHIKSTNTSGPYAFLRLTPYHSGGSSNGYLIKNKTGGTSNSVSSGSLYLYNDSGAIDFVPNGTAADRTTIASNGILTVRSSSDAPLNVVSNDAISGIYFGDPNGSDYLFYIGSTNHLYTHTSTFSVGGSTIASGYEFQVNGDTNVTGAIQTGTIEARSGSPYVYATSTTAANDAVIAARWTAGTAMEMRYHPNTAIGYLQNTYDMSSGQVFGDIHIRQKTGNSMVTRMLFDNDEANLEINTPVEITGNARYVGNYGYGTLVLQDTSGYPGIYFREGNINWLQRKNGQDDDMEWVYSSNASAQGVGSFAPRFTIHYGGGISVHSGLIQLDDSQPIKWGTENILSHNGTTTYLGDNSSASAINITNKNVGIEGDLTIGQASNKGVLNFLTYDDQAHYWAVYTWTDDTFRMNFDGSGGDEFTLDSSGNVNFTGYMTTDAYRTANGWIDFRMFKTASKRLVKTSRHSCFPTLDTTTFFLCCRGRAVIFI